MRLKWLLVAGVPVFAPACFSNNNSQPGSDAGAPRFDAGLPAVDATLPRGPDGSAPEAAPDTYVAEASVPDAPVPEAGPQPVTVVVHSALGPEQGVTVVFQDASGAVLFTGITDALGSASAFVPAGSQATALMGTVASPSLMTIQGVAPGDVLAVYDSSSDLTTSQVSIDVAPDAGPPPGAASFIAHIGGCSYGFISFPVQIPLSPSYDCQAQGAFSVLLNAQAGADGGYADLGYAVQKGNMLPPDGGVAYVTMTGAWSTTTGTETLVPTNVPAGTNPLMSLAEVANGVSTPDNFSVFVDDAGTQDYVFKTFPGLGDSLQGEAALYNPSFLLNSTYALAVSGVATKRLGDSGTSTFDLGQNFPLITQASIDASSQAQPAVAWGSEAGALTPADGVFVAVSWSDLTDAGAPVRGRWTIVAPPASSSVTAPALPPASASWAPSPTASFVAVPVVVVVDADFVADYAQLRAQAGSLPISASVLNGRSTNVAPPLPADGTLKLTAITASGD
jgi:hypothetical protein